VAKIIKIIPVSIIVYQGVYLGVVVRPVNENWSSSDRILQINQINKKKSGLNPTCDRVMVIETWSRVVGIVPITPIYDLVPVMVLTLVFEVVQSLVYQRRLEIIEILSQNSHFIKTYNLPRRSKIDKGRSNDIHWD